jgi:hypothetical protein
VTEGAEDVDTCRIPKESVGTDVCRMSQEWYRWAQNVPGVCDRGYRCVQNDPGLCDKRMVQYGRRMSQGTDGDRLTKLENGGPNTDDTADNRESVCQRTEEDLKNIQQTELPKP